MLRHRDRRLNTATKERYQGFLSGAVPGLTLPSPEEEPERSGKGGRSIRQRQFVAAGADKRSRQVRVSFRGEHELRVSPQPLGLETLGAHGERRWRRGLRWSRMVSGWKGDASGTLASIGVAWWLSVGVVAVHALWFVFKVRSGWVLGGGGGVRQAVAGGVRHAGRSDERQVTGDHAAWGRACNGAGKSTVDGLAGLAIAQREYEIG